MNVDRIDIDPDTERFVVALLIATVVHLVIIYGVSFVPLKPAQISNHSMEIILVQTRTEKSPQQADYLAQANQIGGGEIPQQERPSAPFIAPFPETNPNMVVTPLPPQMAAHAEESQVAELSTPHPSSQTTQSLSPIDYQEGPPEQSSDSLTTDLNEYIAENTLLINEQAAKLASIQAELSAKFNSYTNRLRSKWVHANTKEDKYANYMVAWRQKVEEVGNANYPDKARQQKLSGSLVLDVALNPNGTIRKVVIRKPSPYAILDEAALRIVHLAAPFDPFPKEIRQEIDVLHITRTLEFRYNSLTSR
jgi:protein TonB